MNLAALVLVLNLTTTPPDSVFVTESGTKYHARCHAQATCYRVARLDAEAAGYLPCRPCFRTKGKVRPFDRLPGGAR